MELIDANAPVTALLRALLTEVPAQLRAVNRMASSSAQIRLRGVVASGYVAVDRHDGWVGSDLNHACRLLDAALLRAALRERADDFALCVSDALYTRCRTARPPRYPGGRLPPGEGGQQERPADGRWLHGRCRSAAHAAASPGDDPGDRGKDHPVTGGGGGAGRFGGPARRRGPPRPRRKDGGHRQSRPAQGGHRREPPRPGPAVFNISGGTVSFGGS